MTDDRLVSVRYMVDDVAAAVDFYTTHFGFEPASSPGRRSPTSVRGNLRLLISGPAELRGPAR